MNIPSLRLACQLAAALPALLAPALASAVEQVPATTLAQAVELATQAALALAPAGARVVVEPGALDSRLTLAPCTRIDPYLAAGVAPWGRSRVGLRCVEGTVRWNVFLPLVVQVWAPALSTTTALPAGALITESQLTRVETDWGSAPQPPFIDPAGLVGRTLTRAVAAGQALRPGDLQQRRWYGAGDKVHIIGGGRGFAVNAEGVALNPGIEGQPARVRTESGRVLVGRATGERRVEVEL